MARGMLKIDAAVGPSCCCRHAFESLQLQRLICLVMPGNGASCRVAEHIGMHREMEIVDEYGPALVYALSAPVQRTEP